MTSFDGGASMNLDGPQDLDFALPKLRAKYVGREQDWIGNCFEPLRFLNRFGDPNLYGYVFQDPISYFDPFGLWAYSGGGYIPIWGPFGPGMQVTVAGNPDGTSFLNFKVGVGAGAGFSYDPNAKSPGSDRICGKREALFNIGLYGEANADIPVFSGGVGGDTGIHLGDPSGAIPYVEGGYQSSVSFDPDEPWQVGGDIGAGFQFGVRM
jgi:hypothetical protein